METGRLALIVAVITDVTATNMTSEGLRGPINLPFGKPPDQRGGWRVAEGRVAIEMSPMRTMLITGVDMNDDV